MKRAYPESELHKSVAKYLNLVLCAWTWWTSIAHGETYDFKRGARMKARGAKPSVPDILVLHNGWCFWIELKAEGGKLSPAQKVCHEAITLSGAKVCVCRSIDDVAQSLAEWGIPSRHPITMRKAA